MMMQLTGGLKVHDELLRLALSQRVAKQKLMDALSERLARESSTRTPLICLWLLQLIQPASVSTELSIIPRNGDASHAQQSFACRLSEGLSFECCSAATQRTDVTCLLNV
eukprot:2093595-Pleurochrysis_carterae.AAC.2